MAQEFSCQRTTAAGAEGKQQQCKKQIMGAKYMSAEEVGY